MVAGVPSLTDREKAVLRLLLGGHDAKSSAVALGLSVHTVNERLRNARRKLGVGSSREAARLLAAAEGDHEKLGPTDLGVAEGPAGEAADESRGDGRSARRQWLWAAGGIFMVALAVASALMLTMVPAGDASRPLPDWSQATAVPRDKGPINRLHLDGGRLLWNGRVVSEAHVRTFMEVIAEMKPQPVTVLSYAERTPAARVQEARRLIGENLSCTAATCVEVTGASPER